VSSRSVVSDEQGRHSVIDRATARDGLRCRAGEVSQRQGGEPLCQVAVLSAV